jgi:hypothetical protein
MKVDELIKLLQPGDIGLVRGDTFLSKAIRFCQKLEEGDESVYNHVFIVAKKQGEGFIANGGIYEAVSKLTKNHIKDYIGNQVCIMRHKEMTPEVYKIGIVEVLDNIGQFYPFHVLLLIGVDYGVSWLIRQVTFGLVKKTPEKMRISAYIRPDWPVCSEYGKQLFNTAGLHTGIPIKGWAGVSPDDFDDARHKHPEIWETVYEGILE